LNKQTIFAYFNKQCTSLLVVLGKVHVIASVTV